MAEDAVISVLAGTNGAGKSSIGGAMVRAAGGDYFNPDEATRRIMDANPGVAATTANSEAWQQGKRLLERAIEERLDFAFETTLGGDTITSLLEKALANGIKVRVWYAGLSSPELHIARVRARVTKGGHDIPEAKIRERYKKSLLNLIRLLPKLTELYLYDNSAEAEPPAVAPEPMLLLHLEHRRIIRACELQGVPTWAKPIFAVAMAAQSEDEAE